MNASQNRRHHLWKGRVTGLDRRNVKLRRGALFLRTFWTATCGKPVFSRICVPLEVWLPWIRAPEAGDLFNLFQENGPMGIVSSKTPSRAELSGFFVSGKLPCGGGKRIERICDGPGSPYAIAVSRYAPRTPGCGKHRVEKLSGTTR
jgi:hypothetical protein